MFRLTKIITKTLSVRLSLMVVFTMTILLMASMIIMLFYSRKAVKEEALQKATQTLEGTVRRIDNILLSVEQATGNIYFALLPYLNNPDMMYTYSHHLVEANPYVVGCAIAFKPYYFKNQKLFMAYHHRKNADSGLKQDKAPTGHTDSEFERLESFGDTPYTEQVWYTEPMQSGRPEWLDPLVGMDLANMERIVTFSLPIVGADGHPVGVIGVDVSLALLSQIVLESKPSANSYCTLLMSDGSYIVHPDSNKLFRQTVFDQLEHGADPSVEAAAKAMVSGKTGYLPFRLNGTDYYVFFKPFERVDVPGRAVGNLGWSAGIIYPEDDIFGDYKSLLYYVLAITIVGLLLMFLLCRAIICRQLKPLQMLTEKAQLIAKGNYGEAIPDSHQEDEIGQLQDYFQQMQQSLNKHISELEQQTATLQAHGESLRMAYNEAQKANRMKTAFLHNMTNQMMGPADAIALDVEALCKQCQDSPSDASASASLADNIQKNGKDITEVLNNLLNLSDDEIGKEVTRD